MTKGSKKAIKRSESNDSKQTKARRLGWTPKHEVEHDEQCNEELRFSGACRHGHGFPGNCQDPSCSLNDELLELCLAEFGPHDNHDDCKSMLGVMHGDDD